MLNGTEPGKATVRFQYRGVHPDESSVYRFDDLAMALDFATSHLRLAVADIERKLEEGSQWYDGVVLEYVIVNYKLPDESAIHAFKLAHRYYPRQPDYVVKTRSFLRTVWAYICGAEP